MIIFSFTLKSVLISFMIFCIGTIYAADAKNNNAPKLEYFGSLTYRDIGEVKNFSRNFVANLGSGTLTLANGDVGKVSAPCADFGNAQKELWLDLDVRCTFTMDDGSLLYIFYGGKMIMDDNAMNLMDEGKPWKPKSGIDYWINAPLIRTSSQKYDYMNYIQLIGKGVIADLSAGYVTYNLYKVLYSK